MSQNIKLNKFQETTSPPPESIEEIEGIMNFMDKKSGQEYTYILKNPDNIIYIIENIEKHISDENISEYNVVLAIEWMYRDWSVYEKLCLLDVLLLKPLWSTYNQMRYMNIIELIFCKWSINDLVIYIPLIYQYNQWDDYKLKTFLFYVTKTWNIYLSYYVINYIYSRNYSEGLNVIREILYYKNI
jgi:hypothetical protein